MLSVMMLNVVAPIVLIGSVTFDCEEKSITHLGILHSQAREY